MCYLLADDRSSKVCFLVACRKSVCSVMATFTFSQLPRKLERIFHYDIITTIDFHFQKAICETILV